MTHSARRRAERQGSAGLTFRPRSASGPTATAFGPDSGEDRPFDRLGKLAVRVLSVPIVLVAVIEGERVFLCRGPGTALPDLNEVQAPAGVTVVQELARTGGITLVTDVAMDVRTRENLWLRAMRIRSLAAYPLIAGDGSLLGALIVADTVPRIWTDEELEVLADLADLAASKVMLRAAARLADKTAELLQHSMLTDLPEVCHIELVARYLPAQERAQIGGDWYDAFVLPDDVTAVIIGDVAGHDMPAAAQMGQLRNLLRGIALHTNPAPHEVLSALDTAAHSLGISDLATAIYGRIEAIDDVRWQFRWANAGHPPPLLITADGITRFLDDPSGILLAFGDSQHTDGVVELPPLSTLLLYTDGLVESRHRDIGFGLATLETIAKAAAKWPLPAFCDHILDKLAGDANEDDVTLLAVRIPAGEATHHHPLDK